MGFINILLSALKKSVYIVAVEVGIRVIVVLLIGGILVGPVVVSSHLSRTHKKGYKIREKELKEKNKLNEKERVGKQNE